MRFITLAIIGILLASCNTVQGAGRDIESIGEAGEDAINR